MPNLPEVKEGSIYWYQGSRGSRFPVLVESIQVEHGSKVIHGRQCDDHGRAIGFRQLLILKWIGELWEGAIAL